MENENKGIQFTQYLRPNGRKTFIYIERSHDIEQKAKKITAAGYVFEIEELMNGTISMTCEDGVHEPIAHNLTPNGPAVPVAVDNMISAAFEVLLKLKKVTPLDGDV